MLRQGSGLGIVVQVRPDKPPRDWSSSSHLRFGNLVCIAIGGDFRRPVWAVIANRDADELKKSGTTYLELCSEHNTTTDMEAISLLVWTKGSVMVESPVYYRAYQPVLKCLQDLDVDTIPFANEIIYCNYDSNSIASSVVELAADSDSEGGDVSTDFVTGATTLDGNIIFGGSTSSLTVKEALSHLKLIQRGHGVLKTTLDNSQIDGIAVALKNRVAVIQGPPGTGKTFIGMRVLRLLTSMDTYPANRPVLVLTYKNHALDEFLTDCLEHYDRSEVVRIGGRSESSTLEGLNLNVLKREEQKERKLFEGMKRLWTELDVIKLELRKVLTHAATDDRRFSTDLFLRVSSVQQVEEMLQGCNWAQENVSKGKRLTKNTVQYNIDQARGDDDDFCLREFLSTPNVDVDPSVRSIQANLWTYLDRAIDQWYPAVSVFEQIRPRRVEAPEDLPPEDFSDLRGSSERREVDADAEKERLLAISKGEKNAEKRMWDDEDFVQLDAIKHGDETVDVASLCSDAVATRLLQHSSLWNLSEEQKACLIYLWLDKASSGSTDACTSVAERFANARKELQELEDHHEADVLRSKKVVGMTITGAALRHDLIAKFKPAVVIVEEAAEILEPQLLATLGPWVKRLVMIGDHKQLRPQVNCYTLEKACNRTDHNFDVSMFERLIDNRISHATLQTQNRMRPEFVPMLQHCSMYPDLRSNLDRVERHKAPGCVAHSVFWWNHGDEESPGRTTSNQAEADRVVALALLFVQQGYQPSQITVLAAYQGQRHLIRDKLRSKLRTVWTSVTLGTDSDATALAEEIAVQTIDQYQGDENDIIIVSLVRSNKQNNIGYLKSLNRYIVSVSRERCGVFFVGDADTFHESKDAEHWQYLIKLLEEKDCCSPAIPLLCPRHPASTVNARVASDIDLKCGLCSQTCRVMMPCGLHECGRPCHADRGQHVRCMKQVPVTCAYGHGGFRLCYIPEGQYVCSSPCSRKLRCGHPCTNLCGQPCAETCELCVLEAERQRKELAKSFEREMAALYSTMQKKKPSLTPWYWNLQGGLASAATERYDVTKDMKAKMQHLIDGSCNRRTLGRGKDQVEPGDYTGLQVVKVEQIESPQLWMIYQLRKVKLVDDVLKKKCPETPSPSLAKTEIASYDHSWMPKSGLLTEVNEVFLFHGTKPDIADKVIETGFEERLASLGGLYGAGAYFAEKSSKSDQYTSDDGNGNHHMFLARVALGAHVKETHAHCNNIRILEEIPGGTGVRYSSLLGLKGAHREFIVFDGGQAYPEFLITYKRTRR